VHAVPWQLVLAALGEANVVSKAQKEEWRLGFYRVSFLRCGGVARVVRRDCAWGELRLSCVFRGASVLHRARHVLLDSNRYTAHTGLPPSSTQADLFPEIK
jgi:hypothetical protein